MSREDIITLDPVVHAPVRLAVLSILAGVKDADFVYLKETTETSSGNLSTHLRKLDDAGYVTIVKSFKDRKPRTTCSLTRKGRAAFVAYLEQLERFLELQRTGKGE